MQERVVQGVPQLSGIDEGIVVSLEDELGGDALVRQDPLQQERRFQRQVGETVNEVVLHEVVVHPMLVHQC